ncbi:SusC/RagA family TonB-linked outer membrane protein [Sphingobacterium paucimobilis]|uniref:Secretin/TonB short N-terminal domain-containing protein n=1 Tax=Sphingobacterium paucimobilis HER1398 TaxID=1346330 RepID=U2IWV6_9SPHI|nr:SusC/RagA family TonB-linked outer membrane protein [Sphingobacterium paucimobilis]ERJ57164.1 hypothetical protein M472_00145 [Sphingobacterium paucimobilis HER1398]
MKYKNKPYRTGRGIISPYIFLMMKLTICIFFISILGAMGGVTAQRVHIDVKGVPLQKVLIDIGKQSKHILIYDDKDFKDAKKVNQRFSNKDLSAALDLLLEGQSLQYTIQGKSIMISRKSKPAISASMPIDELIVQSLIKGRVTNDRGEPLVGASIKVKNTKIGTTTDDEGYFVLNNVENSCVLIISFIGYLDREVNGAGDIGSVRLRLNDNPVDEVQVIAYGTESKRLSVGAVSSVSADEIARQPVTNPLLALQGQVAGLAISATNGVPGSTALVQVRGQNTLGTTLQVKPYDQPLFIIDGVPFAPQNVNINQLNNLATAQSFNGGISQPTGLSPFNSINPNDIESISILKDAAATSIYGSQAANGVVLITTKRGKSGKTTLDINLNTQFNSTARPSRLMNTQQYLQLRREAYAIDGLVPSDDPNDYEGFAPDLTIFEQDKYTNWQKIITGKMTRNTDMHATLSGGSASNTFLVAAGYTSSDYNYPGDFSDKRFTLHSAIHNTSANDRFTLDLVADYGYDQNNSANYQGRQGVLLAPNMPDLVTPNGDLVWNYNGYPLEVQNFYSSLMQPVYLQNYNFNSSLRINYKIAKGLTIGTNVGFSRSNTDERSENPARSQNPSFAEASAGFGSNVSQAINVEPQLNYNLSIGGGILTALLGGTYKKVTNDAYQVEGYGYSNDNFLGSIIGATDTYPFETKNLFKYSAGFARLKYIYDQKYILEASGRRDGSSNFGPGRQFGNFASIGAAWIFSEEKIIRDLVSFLGYGKFSGSYGTTGGDASKAYSYQALYENLSGVLPFQGIKPAYAYNLYNPDFSWATKKSLNLALDLSFIDNRISVNTTFYRNRQGNQLVDMPLPVQTGFTRVFGNLDALVQNKGWEFTIMSSNVKNDNFSWSSTFNLTFNRNKLLDFPDLASSAYANKYIIGQPTSIIIGYKYKGVNPDTGLYEFYDKDGNTTYNPKFGMAANGGDQVPIGNMDIKYMGGIGNNFTYKDFGLYIFCQFSSSYSPNYLSALYTSDFPGAPTNQPVAILDNYWQQPGDDALIQRLASSYNSSSLRTIPIFTQSDGVYSNNTYLRVKTVALSYTLPERILKHIHVKGGGIYANAQNLFTITNYKVGDPEQPGTITALPLQRIVALGLNLKF